MRLRFFCLKCGIGTTISIEIIPPFPNEIFSIKHKKSLCNFADYLQNP